MGLRTTAASPNSRGRRGGYLIPGLAVNTSMWARSRLPRQLLLHCSPSCIPAVVSLTVPGPNSHPGTGATCQKETAEIKKF